MKTEHPLYQCRWIGGAPECASPIIKRPFTAQVPLSAKISITGLGYFTAWINGEPLTDCRLQPVCSEYGPRDLGAFLYPLKDRLTYRIYYCTYDVTHLVKAGENLLSIQLGNGWYRQTERTAEGPVAYGSRLKTIYCLTLTYPDGQARICSDGSETWQESAIVYNNLFVGEIHDLRRKAAFERSVDLLPEEPAVLSEQIGVPDRVIRRLIPTLLSEQNGIRIYDAGENISGVVCLTVSGKAGEQVVLRFAENLAKDGSLDFASTGSGCICASGIPQIQRDICICGGEPAVFAPRFCWHAFRYFEITGPGLDPVAEVIHSDVAVTASFDSDSEGLNFLFDAFLRTQLNNMHGSIPSDCPHRERLGYTGDGQATAAAAMMLLESKPFYHKWMRDILDCQDQVTGHTQHTAPLGGGGGGPVGWGGAIVVVPYRYFKQYGDLQLLRESWDAIQKWIGYIRTRMESYLITREEPGGWCLGDWAAPGKTVIPEPFVNTCLFVSCLDMLRETAPLLDRGNDCLAFETLQERCRKAIMASYFDAGSGRFCGGIQGADAFGLYAGLGDERTKTRLIERYEDLACFDTGFLGTDVLLEVLFRIGAADTAYKLMTSEKCGSFLYMKRHGATTLWENWDGRESQDHPMFGGCVRHLYEGFLGIRQRRGTGGYEDVTVTPYLPKEMQRMTGSLRTPIGTIRVSLGREGGNVTQHIVVPKPKT